MSSFLDDIIKGIQEEEPEKKDPDPEKKDQDGQEKKEEAPAAFMDYCDDFYKAFPDARKASGSNAS